MSLIKMMKDQLASDILKGKWKSSRNFLQEIKIQSLSSLYQRSLIEYKEFKTFFKQPINFNIFHTNDR